MKALWSKYGGTAVYILACLIAGMGVLALAGGCQTAKCGVPAAHVAPAPLPAPVVEKPADPGLT